MNMGTPTFAAGGCAMKLGITLLALLVPITFGLAAEVRIKTPALVIPLPGLATDMALAPDGKTVATATKKGPITIWDVSTGKPVREFESLDDETGRVAFSADGTLLAGAGKLGHQGVGGR